MKPIEFKTRDGLTIHGYLTLPLDGIENLRSWLTRTAARGSRQLATTGSSILANRGYAVLQVNFAARPVTVENSGNHLSSNGARQWDDTATVWLIEQGIADPS